MRKFNPLFKKLQDLEKNRRSIDYDTAGVLYEIKKMTRDAADFIMVMKSQFDVSHVVVNMWLRTAKLYPKYEKKQWQNYGGRIGIQKLDYLNTQQRARVTKILDARIKKTGNGVSEYYVSETIRRCGYRTQVTGAGRHGRVEAERKLVLCQNWLDNLYKNYDLPEPPLDVKKAMRNTDLARSLKTLKVS